MTEKDPYKIPNRLIFVWYGKELPWTAMLSILSAVEHCRPEEILLIHDGLGEKESLIRECIDCPGLKMPEAGPQWFEGEAMKTAKELYGQVTSPAARSNLMRLAALYQYGGIYLDTDTITVKPFDALRLHSGFCGLEPLALPASLYRAFNPFAWMKAGLLLALRDACVRLPRGYDTFRHIERFYTLSVNNAVIGSMPGNPIIEKMFRMMKEMPASERLKRYRLGTHLLQAATGDRSSRYMNVTGSAPFYPLGPEISTHLFKKGSNARLREMVPEETLTIHWYQSVYSRMYPNGVTLAKLEEEDTAFAKLAAPYRGRLTP